jgi:hypothetical protein
VLNTNKSVFTRLVAVAVLAVSVAGCTTRSTASTIQTAPGQASLMRVTLAYQPSGTAALTWDRQSANVVAKLQIGGFMPGSTYAMDIRKGSCAALGDVAVPFPKVTADNGGAITTTVTGDRPAPGGLLPATAISVRLDVGVPPGSPEPPPMPLACADITAAVVTANLPMAPVGERAKGWANLTYNSGNKTLIVATAASGLAPGSIHAQHIGVGTCAAQGAVKYALTDLVASANGTAYQTTVVENVDQPPPAAGGWYLNVRSGSSDQISQTGQPNPFAAPIVCGDIGTSVSAS